MIFRVDFKFPSYDSLSNESLLKSILHFSIIALESFAEGEKPVLEAECSLLTKLRQHHMLNEKQVIFNTYL